MKKSPSVTCIIFNTKIEEHSEVFNFTFHLSVKKQFAHNTASVHVAMGALQKVCTKDFKDVMEGVALNILRHCTDIWKEKKHPIWSTTFKAKNLI